MRGKIISDMTLSAIRLTLLRWPTDQLRKRASPHRANPGERTRKLRPGRSRRPPLLLRLPREDRRRTRHPTETQGGSGCGHGHCRTGWGCSGQAQSRSRGVPCTQSRSRRGRVRVGKRNGEWPTTMGSVSKI